MTGFPTIDFFFFIRDFFHALYRYQEETKDPIIFSVSTLGRFFQAAEGCKWERRPSRNTGHFLHSSEPGKNTMGYILIIYLTWTRLDIYSNHFLLTDVVLSYQWGNILLVNKLSGLACSDRNQLQKPLNQDQPLLQLVILGCLKILFNLKISKKIRK